MLDYHAPSPFATAFSLKVPGILSYCQTWEPLLGFVGIFLLDATSKLSFEIFLQIVDRNAKFLISLK